MVDFRWTLDGKNTSIVDIGWTTILWEDLSSYGWAPTAGGLD